MSRRRSPVEAVGDAMNRVAARLMPEPFILAALLTFLVLVLSLMMGREVTELPLGQRLETVLVKGWYGGLFGSGGLTFAFQMILVLVTGFAFARGPAVQRVIDALASAPRSAGQASALVALVACTSGYLHWGLGAVAGAMLAREIGRSWAQRGRPLHYPLLGAAAYSGLLVWHGGLSGSAPLKVAEPGHFLEKVTGVIAVDQTLFSATNLIIVGLLFSVTVGLYYLLTPSDPEDMVPFQGADAGEGAASKAPQEEGIAQWALIRLLDRSPLVPTSLALLGLGYLAYDFWNHGFSALNLNTVNLAFFSAGLLLHGSAQSYIEAASRGAKGSVGIILQFPLYFGLLGMLKASGLIAQISDTFVALSTQDTLPLLTYLSAGLVNLFGPSGGGQWAVQGPVIMSAAKELGADQGKVIIALAHGDAWTNMLQPFWALPLLGIMGLKARDIAGYTTLLFLVAGPVTLLALWLL